MLDIQNVNWQWKGSLSKRQATDYIVLHHAAIKDASPTDIHNSHLKKGWSGIGYNFYIQKDGTITEGRPINTIGAHCTNYNSKSIGICFEGNFEIEIMSEAQIKAGQDLVKHCQALYPGAVVVAHKAFMATACPGKNFPFEEIVNPKFTELTDVNDIVWELSVREIITNKELWLIKLADDNDSYWLARKIINYLRKAGV